MRHAHTKHTSKYTQQDIHIHKQTLFALPGDIEAGLLLTEDMISQLKSELQAAGVAQAHIEQVLIRDVHMHVHVHATIHMKTMS